MSKNGQARRNRKILRKVQSPKAKPGRNRNINRPITSTEIETEV